MANILNCRAIFSQIWKQQKADEKVLEAEALKFRVLMNCQNQQNLKKVRGNNIVKCVQKRYFSYITDNFFSFRGNFSKVLVILV